MKRFVIAVTRTCGSGGTTVAKLLAERFGVKMYNREILNLASEESGFSEALFLEAEEKIKPPRLFQKVSESARSGEFVPNNMDAFSPDNLFNYQAMMLKRMAQNESYVVVGRAAYHVLRNLPQMMSVFFSASHEKCVARIMEMFGMSAAEAEKHIEKENKHRKKYYLYHTGKQWEAPENYNLCLRTDLLGYEGCADLIEYYLKKRGDLLDSR
jgi:cytidylate kinase